jgi:iron complex outermembrane receptor protein
MRRYVLIVIGVTLSGAKVSTSAHAQAPAPSPAARPQDDTSRSKPQGDSTRLPELEVRVTRAEENRSRAPVAIGVLGVSALRRAQLTSGLDESLSRLPGVVVLNRYNYSLDQRVSLRGAGSRANFGLRGVKVLIDGVPQTLPDGQSQLTNLELGIVDRVEVLTGSAGALYGNASGGVLAFGTETPIQPFAARVRIAGGAFGTSKWQSMVSGVRGGAAGAISISRLTTDGFRQHSRAEVLQVTGKADLALSGSSTLGVRFAIADAPRAENPGALTLAEYAHTRDSAAFANIVRGADKSVSQEQLSLRYHWGDQDGKELEAIAFGFNRDLKNPLATAPPAPALPSAGTYNTIGRVAGGMRVGGSLPLARGSRPLRLSAGFDLQTMRDNRRNQRSDAGAPTGVLLADQRETVTEIGPYAQLHWEPVSRVLLLGAIRYDRLTFRVKDRLLTDGIDNSGKRVMENASGSVGASVSVGSQSTVYTNVSTSFESPTTTELVNQANGTVGFNTALGPQRTLSGEVGLKGSLGGRLQYTVAAFASGIRDAIIQAREQDGRAFFQNAGRVKNRGVELGIGATPWRWLSLSGAYTYAGYTFSEYRIPNGAATDTLDGKRLAGVPRNFFRAVAGLTVRTLVLEVDQTTAGAVFGDDRNTLRVDGWGAGVTSVRLSGTVTTGALRLQPFGALNNAFDRRYVGSVNINGFGGRVLEPAPGRNALVGLEVGWR